jgi:integrase
LRHSLVSLLSDSGVSLEEIADLCGHSGTSITESVYRHELRPVPSTEPSPQRPDLMRSVVLWSATGRRSDGISAARPDAAGLATKSSNSVNHTGE